MTIPNQMKVIPSALGGATGSGTITANGGSVQLEIDGAPSVVVQTSGTWQLDLVAQTSIDGVNWSNPLYLWEMDRFPAFHGHIQLGMNAIGGATSRNGQYRVSTEGATYVRIFAQAAGGTPGTATVTITPSPAMVAFPTSGYNILVFDALVASATKTSPIVPAPPPGWRWDNSETITGLLTSINNPIITAQISDTYAFTLNSAARAFTLGNASNNNSYLSGESPVNGRQTMLSNFIRFAFSASAYSTGGGTYTVWINFCPPTISDFTFGPGVADQTTLPSNSVLPDIGNLNAGTFPWIGAMALATDSAANTNAGKLRRLRVDANQNLQVALAPQATPSASLSYVKRKARNVNATVQTISSFANGVLHLVITNASAAAAFVNLYDVASGSITVGTTAPDYEFEVPAGTTLVVPFNDFGVWFSTAINVVSVTTDNGATGSAAGVHVHAVTMS